MDLTIPIYVETTAGSRQGAEYVVRPLFFEAPIERSRLLPTALQKLTTSLRRQLVELGRQQRHDALASWSSCPELETQQCRVRIERDGTITRLRLLLIRLRRFQRRLAFSPAFPELWFELLPDEDPEQRLTEALTAHLQKLAVEGRSIDHDSLLQRSLEGSAWVTEIQLRLSPERVRAGKRNNAFAMLGSAEQMDGEWELYRVGRSLNDLDLHDLSRAVLRESEVRELEQVLSATDRRPVVLLGRRQSGKTTVLHEYVFRSVERTGNQQGEGKAVWLISPQRLISGMPWVGQWETRFHAIMKFAARRDLVLYFDDLVGLFQAGVTSQSTISAAALLKTIMINRTVRVCGELTPAEFRVLQERVRSFADQFHVIRVEELAGAANLRVLLGLQRQLEVRYGVRFQLETLPAIIDLQRRYVRDAAFPGKAAGLMQRLAVKFEAESEDAPAERRRTVPISLENVFEFFRQQSGLPLSFLDQRTRLERGQIISALRERFVGQPQAVNAAVEIISIARARLNDPSRPLATLLLLGPTGVGKTEFARSLAGCLFGSAERLLRFDMNEFVSPTAVPLLAGTFSQPDGLLTAAVRRQPFAVLLFDEIEKAHPNVFDLLLQVLGEGRLTDARGRTTDFSNTLILLTSNLGTQRSESSLGFGGAAEESGQLAIRAAEQFFRPEFFNRLDRVIPFERLSRADVQGIARHLLTGVQREKGSWLLIGETGCGKTTVLCEAAREIERRLGTEQRAHAESLAPLRPARRFWQTSAGRIISGMMYLGEWQEHLERMIEDLAAIDGVLCIESLAELLRTGGREASESLAAFLAPWLQRNELRMIAEVTPTQLDACRRLLLDEIEKAHPAVFDLLMNVFDEGRLTDRFGRITWFRSTVIVMTSNLGAESSAAVGFGEGAQQSAARHEKAVREFFRPEFFNRLDRVVTFEPLSMDVIEGITEKELRQIAAREGLVRRGVRLSWTPDVVRHLAKAGFDPRYGARPLQRTLESSIIAPLALKLVQNATTLPVEIRCVLSDGQVVLQEP